MSWNVDEIVRLMEQDIPFNRYLGLKALVVTPECVELLLPFKPELIGDPKRHVLHGGTISMLIDTAGGAVAFMNVESNERVSTVDLVVDYLLPGPPADVVARARVVRRGNRVVTSNVEVSPANDRSVVVAQGRGVYNIHKKTPNPSS